jgi:hypothetical protein
MMGFSNSFLFYFPLTEKSIKKAILSSLSKEIAIYISSKREQHVAGDTA